MRITEVDPVVVSVPLKIPVRGVHGTIATQRSVLVRVATAGGAEGWGNVDPVGGYSTVSADEVASVIGRPAPALLGADALNAQRALAAMDAVGEGAPEVHFNAWIGTVPPEQAAGEATEWAARGFRSAKIKLDGATEEGLARVAAVRAAVGDRLALRVDFNESLTLAEAVPFILRLEPYALTLVEQPIPRDQIAGLVEIRRGIDIPLMADESVTDPASLIDIIRRGAADLVKAMIECAAAAGLRVVVGHGFGLTPSTLAEAALAAVSEAVIDGCEAVGPLKMAGDVVAEPVSLEAGTLRLSQAPGLGAAIDPDALKRYRVP